MMVEVEKIKVKLSHVWGNDHRNIVQPSVRITTSATGCLKAEAHINYFYLPKFTNELVSGE